MNATPKSERKAPDPSASTAAMPSEAAAVGVAVSMSSRGTGEMGSTSGAEASNGPNLPASSASSDSTDASSQVSGSDDVSAAGKRQRAAAAAAKKSAAAREAPQPNNVRKLRQNAMMSKAELARRAGVSPLTIDRVEAGYPCRMDTKRKILEALGLSPSARAEVWPDID